MVLKQTTSPDLSKVFEVQANFPFSFSNFWGPFSLAYLAREASAVKKHTKSSFELPATIDQALGGMLQGDLSFEFTDTNKKTFIKFYPKTNTFNLFTIDAKNSMILDAQVFSTDSWNNDAYLIGCYLASNHPELLAPFDEFEPGHFKAWE